MPSPSQVAPSGNGRAGPDLAPLIATQRSGPAAASTTSPRRRARAVVRGEHDLAGAVDRHVTRGSRRSCAQSVNGAAAHAQPAARPRRSRRRRRRRPAGSSRRTRAGARRARAIASSPLARELRALERRRGPAGRAPPRRRTRRRRRTRAGGPRAVASAISSSMWSVKNWNGAGSPYSSPMKSIGVNGDSSVQNAASGRASAGRRSPKRAVADLVVVLVEDDELLGAAVVGGRAEAAAAERRVVAVVDVRAPEGLRELARARRTPRSSRRVSPVSSDAQRVVEVVGPGGVAAPAAGAARARMTFGSLRPRLGDHERAGVARVDAVGELARRCASALVSKIAWIASSRSPSRWKSRIQPSALWRTHSRTASESASSKLIALPQNVSYLLGEVRAERLQRRDARGADVVVDDVEDHARGRRRGRRRRAAGSPSGPP